MKPEVLRTRTKLFASRIIKVVAALPQNMIGRTLGGQLIRSGTSVGANYRAACRGRSKKEFIAKLGVVIEEADETVFWLELIAENGLLSPKRLEPLLREANELVCIMVASRRTALKRRLASKKSPITNHQSSM